MTGFTLLEMSIVLALIAVILGGALFTSLGFLQATQFNTTVARMDTIEKAILDFAVANDRIPCPGDMTLTPTNATTGTYYNSTAGADYGAEAGSDAKSAIGTGTGACSGTNMTPQANFTSSTGTAEGGVPTRALKLTDDYMYDGWGRRFRYAVDPTYTKSSSLPVTASCTLTPTPDASAITVNDASGAARTISGMYVLLSHGANGHGAYTANGTTMNAASTNTSEWANCHCNATGVSQGYPWGSPVPSTPTYVEQSPAYASGQAGVAAYYYDDIVTFKEPWQMQALNFPLTANTCTTTQYIYVADTSNDRVQIFNSSGSYLSQFGTFGTTGGGQFNSPQDVAVNNSSGTIFVSDMNNERVQMFNSSGSFIGQIGCSGSSACATGTGNGQFNTPNYLFVDAGNNLWVTDQGNYRIQKFSSSGSFISQFGAQGTGNGQFKTPQGVAINSGGTMWVADWTNNNVQEFNSSGSYLSQEGAPGSTSFSSAAGDALDGSNLWVGDYGHGRVVEFNSSGSYVGQIGCSGTGDCFDNSANGGFGGPNDVAVDNGGNIWVVDQQNNRVQKFSSSGTWLLSIGGPSPYTCETSPAGSVPACAAGSGNGQFSSPVGIGIGNR